MPTYPLPELLAPAGSPGALDAAIAAGADAVYLGGSRFNARMGAHNFDPQELREAITHAHRMGTRVYLTLNTLTWDRELSDTLRAAYDAAVAGVDALIIADLGAAALIRRALPALPLHASTQLSGHNAAIGQMLAPLGFSRFVIARETRLDDLAAAVRNNPLEVEVFIHGALCVSHSGQCLFSSVVGGRSGNRGECAQPCRLPYTSPDARGRGENYPLSLKDLSLAAHVPALMDAGVSSLKIEGRMKSPGYVGGVTAIWRRLLDEGRAATPDEMTALADLFSREGFTDGYQTGKITRSMMGVRSDADKSRTAAAERAALTHKHPPHLPVRFTFTAKLDEPTALTAEAPLFRSEPTSTVSVTVEGNVPAAAETPSAALTREGLEKQLARTGGTPYRVCSVEADLPADSPLMLPLSRLNAQRREALAALDAARARAMPTPAAGYTPTAPEALMSEPSPASESTPAPRTARFYTAEQITKAAMEYFDILYLPLGTAHPASLPAAKRGAILPPVIFDREADAVRRSLETALEGGIRHLLVGNVGHIPLVREVVNACGLSAEEVHLHGDFRLNVTNALAAARLLSLGLCDLTFSPELTVPRMRDLARALPDRAGGMVYGRLPLMLLEKCAIREIYRHKPPAEVCREICGRDAAVLRDRKGMDFPVLREDSPCGQGHRNVVYNSLPLCMSDRWDDVARIGLASHHFLFSVESPAEVDAVIRAYQSATPLGRDVRRVMK